MALDTLRVRAPSRAGQFTYRAMFKRVKLTHAQVAWARTLYAEHYWSIIEIATVAGVGRRTIELALTRRGSVLRKPGPPVRALRATSTMTVEVARREFQAAALIHEDLDPPFKVYGRGRTAAYVYRRRRCHYCGRLSAYQTHCPSCTTSFIAHEPSVEDHAVTLLRLSEENRE